jgi:hypothetical protein
MSPRRCAGAPDRLAAERIGLEAFIAFVRRHPELYRIIEEAQFVAQDVYREHYLTFADAYRRNLAAARERGEIAGGEGGPDEPRAWALIGMSVFLGMRYGIWDEDLSPAEVADRSPSTSSPKACASAAMIADLPDLIAKRAALTPGRDRARGAATGRTLTYAELDRAPAAPPPAGGAGRRRGRPGRDPLPQPDRLLRAAVRLRQARRDPGAAQLADAAGRARRLIADCRAGLLFHGAEDAAARPRRSRRRRPRSASTGL